MSDEPEPQDETPQDGEQGSSIVTPDDDAAVMMTRRSLRAVISLGVKEGWVEGQAAYKRSADLCVSDETKLPSTAGPERHVLTRIADTVKASLELALRQAATGANGGKGRIIDPSGRRFLS